MNRSAGNPDAGKRDGFVRSLARRARGLAGGEQRRLFLLVLAGFVVAGVAIAGFALLADAVLEGQTTAFDDTLLRWAGAHRTPAATRVALQVTALGNAATLILVLLIASALLWVSRHRGSVYLLWVAMITGGVLGSVLKHVFHRARPDIIPWLTSALLSSFPSGHALDSAVTYGTVAYLVGRLASPGFRIASWTLAALLILVIGLSRIYVGVHYPSDVLAGWLAATAWVAILVLACHTYPALTNASRQSPHR